MAAIDGWVAATEGKVEEVSWWLILNSDRIGMEGGAEGTSLLYTACRHDRADIVQLLLDNKCDLEQVFADGFRPL